MPRVRRPSKYGNRKVEYHGIKFDSKKEMNRYIELKLLQRAHEISGLNLQPSFIIHDAFVDSTGNIHQAIKYRANFSYVDANGDKVIEDVKGMKTKEYLIKKKLFLKRYPEYKFLET